MFVVHPNLEKGSLQVKLTNAVDETVVEEKASGNASAVSELVPGDCSIRDGDDGRIRAGGVEFWHWIERIVWRGYWVGWRASRNYAARVERHLRHPYE